MTSGLSRALVYLKRIAAALERAHPAPRRPRRTADFSVASTADFDAGWDQARAEGPTGMPEEPRRQ